MIRDLPIGEPRPEARSFDFGQQMDPATQANGRTRDDLLVFPASKPFSSMLTDVGELKAGDIKVKGVTRLYQLKRWKTKYFSLREDGCLYCFDNENSRPDFEKVYIVRNNCVVRAASPKLNRFYVDLPRKTYLFQATNRQDYDEWLRAYTRFQRPPV